MVEASAVTNSCNSADWKERRVLTCSMGMYTPTSKVIETAIATKGPQIRAVREFLKFIRSL